MLPPAAGGAGPLCAGLVEAAPAVRRFLFGLCGDWHHSEDLAQEAMLSAWQKRDSFDGRACLQTWVFAIARNAWLTSLRRRSRRPGEQPLAELGRTDPSDPSGTPADSAARAELTDAVAAALGHLPDEQREVLALCHNAGLTFARAAAVLGVPVGTVKGRARLALLKLARELEPFRQELEP